MFQNPACVDGSMSMKIWDGLLPGGMFQNQMIKASVLARCVTLGF